MSKLSSRNYYTVSGIVFALVAAVHALRLVRGWEANVDGWQVPMWLNVTVVVLLGYLAYNARINEVVLKRPYLDRAEVWKQKKRGNF